MRPGRVGLLWAVLLAVVITGPLLLRPGFALIGDMVFVPRQPWKDAWLGLDGSVPRAVPSDALVSVASQVVPGDLIQKLVLAGLLVAAGWGAVRMVGGDRVVPQLAAATLFVWNPFVYERLAIGHWALLCGYAVLPWVVVCAQGVRDGRVRGLARLAVPLAVAAWTSPTGGVLAGLVALAVVLARPQVKGIAGTALLALAVNLPWIVPGVLSSASLPADPAGVAAFAARPDTPLGTVGSLFTLGGIWKTSVAVPGRETSLLAAAALLVSGAAVVGLLMAVRRRNRTAMSLAALAVVTGLIAVAPSTDVGEAMVEWVVEHIPGGGLLRDSQKWIAPLALAQAFGIGALAAAAGDGLRRFGAHSLGWLAAAVLVLPIATMPALAWGLFGELEPAEYPAEWDTVAARLDEPDLAGRQLAVLPWGIYRRFSWNDQRAVLDPAPRYFAPDVLTDDSLVVDAVVVGGEDARAAAIRHAVDAADDIVDAVGGQGVGLVLVEKDSPGAPAVGALGGQVVHDGPQLALVDVGGGERVESAMPGRRLVITGDVVAGSVVLGCLCLLASGRRRRYTATGP